MDKEKIDHEYTDEVVCPYCGYEDKDSWEYSHDDYDDLECGSCGKHFSMGRSVRVTYSTYKMRDDCEHTNSWFRNDFWMCDDCGLSKRDREAVLMKQSLEKVKSI